jgi:hypothetical protein
MRIYRIIHLVTQEIFLGTDHTVMTNIFKNFCSMELRFQWEEVTQYTIH